MNGPEGVRREVRPQNTNGLAPQLAGNLQSVVSIVKRKASILPFVG